MGTRFVARAFTTGYDDGDVEGPFYRYFYETDLDTAVKRTQRDGQKMFEDALDDFGCGVLCLDVKQVGKVHSWIQLFDGRREHYEHAMAEYRRQVENLRKYGNIYGPNNHGH